MMWLHCFVIFFCWFGSDSVADGNNENQDSKAQESNPHHNPFLEMNEDPAPHHNLQSHVFVKTKTRLHVPEKTSDALSFMKPRSKSFYPIPNTQSTRLEKGGHPVPSHKLYLQPHGIAAYADWVHVASVSGKPEIFGATLKPQVIFTFTDILDQFAETVLPLLVEPFVLISAVNDLTVPVNLDKRSGLKFFRLEGFSKVANHSLLIHMYVENLHMGNDIIPKVSPIPIGASRSMESPDDWHDYPKDVLPIRKRPLKVLVGDKRRDMPGNEAAQWKDRNDALDLCKHLPNECETILKGDGAITGHAQWIKKVSDFPFLLCTHGGGIDPSPKAWEALIVGTIPIMDRNSLYEAYSQLPIAFVPKTTEFLTWSNITQYLEKWLNELGPYYEDNSVLRNQTMHRLTTAYWHSVVTSKIPNYRYGYINEVN